MYSSYASLVLLFCLSNWKLSLLGLSFLFSSLLCFVLQIKWLNERNVIQCSLFVKTLFFAFHCIHAYIALKQSYNDMESESKEMVWMSSEESWRLRTHWELALRCFNHMTFGSLCLSLCLCVSVRDFSAPLVLLGKRRIRQQSNGLIAGAQVHIAATLNRLALSHCTYYAISAANARPNKYA